MLFRAAKQDITWEKKKRYSAWIFMVPLICVFILLALAVFIYALMGTFTRLTVIRTLSFLHKLRRETFEDRDRSQRCVAFFVICRIRHRSFSVSSLKRVKKDRY